MHNEIPFGKSKQGFTGRKVPVYKLRFNNRVNTEEIKKSLLACKLIDFADLWSTEWKGRAYNNILFACFPQTSKQDIERIEAILTRFKAIADAEEALERVAKAQKIILKDC
jgi:hypothetical protein